MITIPVDESYALDFLSILRIKSTKSAQSQNYYKQTLEHIQAAIGAEKADAILASNEYAKLTEANLKVFDAVDKARVDKIPASEVDALNYQRYLRKQAIQTTFFNSNLVEEKFGYEQR